MNNIIIFLAIIGGLLPSNINFTYSGASGGNWSVSSNWTPSSGAPPNATNATATVSGVASVKVDVNDTINRLILSGGTQGTISTSTANNLIFDGTNPSISFNMNSGLNYTISSPFTLNQNLIIQGTNTGGTLTLGKITASSKNITQENMTGALPSLVSFSTTGNTGITGGNYYLNEGSLSILTTAMNGTSGPTITMSNVNHTTIGGSFTNPLVLSDTGSNAFIFGGDNINSLSTAFTGAPAISGSITNNLYFGSYGNDLSGNYSGLSFSGGSEILIGSVVLTLTSTTLSSSPTIQIGVSTVNQPADFYENNAITNSNNINVECGTSVYTRSFDVAAGTTHSGNVVINYNNLSTSGALFYIGRQNTSNGTISGVISNGGANTSNVTLYIYQGEPTFSGTNTYSSPTSVVGTSSKLNVTGSTANSTTTITGGGLIQGSGTYGPVTSSGATTNKITAGSLVSPTTSQVLTIQGNLTETEGVTHTFYINSSGNSSSLQVNGNVTLSGTVAVSGSTGGTPHAYIIGNYTGTTSGSWTTAISGATITNVGGVITLNTTL